jgi:hypothetical protein
MPAAAARQTHHLTAAVCSSLLSRQASAVRAALHPPEPRPDLRAGGGCVLLWGRGPQQPGAGRQPAALQAARCGGPEALPGAWRRAPGASTPSPRTRPCRGRAPAALARTRANPGTAAGCPPAGGQHRGGGVRDRGPRCCGRQCGRRCRPRPQPPGKGGGGVPPLPPQPRQAEAACGAHGVPAYSRRPSSLARR